MRLLAGGICLLAMNAAAGAQTVRPLINELSNPAKGRVEYVNDGLTPLNVVLEAKSFTVSETGEIAYRPLDADVHLKLSATSFRIQPQQTYYVFYEASSPQSPNWFVIYAAFSGFTFRTAQGMNVRLELPHTVYLLPKQQVEKPEIKIDRAELKGGGYLVTPDGTGPHPGVVVIHEVYGLNYQIREICQRFAAAGYAALAVDLFTDRNRAVCMTRYMAGMLLGSVNRYGVSDLKSAMR